MENPFKDIADNTNAIRFEQVLELRMKIKVQQAKNAKLKERLGKGKKSITHYNAQIEAIYEAMEGNSDVPF